MSKNLSFREFQIWAKRNVLLLSPGTEEIAYKDLLKILKEAEDKERGSVGQQALRAYIAAFKRYRQGEPVFEAKDTRRLKEIAKQQGFDRTLALIDTYFRMADSNFAFHNWSLSRFLYDIARVQAQLDNQNAVSRTEANRIEKRQGNAKAFSHLLRKGDT